MIDISRRLFLIGTTAALVAPVLPTIVRSEATQIRLSSRFDYRAIYDFMFSVDRDGMPNRAASLSLRRGNGNVLLNYGIAPGGCLRWRALDGNEIIATVDAPLLIKVEPAVASGQIAIIYNADRPSVEVTTRERARVAACKDCDGVGYREKIPIVMHGVPLQGFEPEYENEPCPTCGGLDRAVMHGHSFYEMFQFGTNGEVSGGEPCAFDLRDVNWQQAA